jgi:hypothetical protein
MALRELIFDINFKGETKAVQRVDKAVDELKTNAEKMGRSFKNNLTDGSKAFASSIGGLAKKMGQFGLVAGTAAAAGIGAITTKSILAASDVEEMSSKFDTVFAGMSGTVRTWADEQAKAIGRSKYEIQGYLAESQNMLVGMGATREEGAELSKQITELGIDLASFNNLQDADAVNSLNKAIMGEHENAKALGAVLNENTLARAQQTLGITAEWKELSEAEKMQVRYQAIVDQSSDALGDAERTSGSFANQMKALKSGVSDMTAELGVQFLPVATEFISKINDNMPQIKTVIENVFNSIKNGVEVATPYFLTAVDVMTTGFDKIQKVAGWVTENMDVLTPVLISVGVAIGAALIPAFIAWTVATWAQVVATWALAAPILAVMAPIIAIGVAIGAAIYIWKRWGDQIKEFGGGILEGAKNAFTAVLNFIEKWHPLAIVKRALNAVVDFFGQFSLAEVATKVVMSAINAFMMFNPLSITLNAMNAVSEFLFGVNLFDAGKNIIQGLIDGMTKMFKKVKEIASNIGSAVVDKFKDIFKINSPSKVMTDIGINNIKGLDKGMVKGEDQLEKTVQGTSDIITRPLVGATSNSSTFSPNLNITVNGGDTKETVRVLKSEWEKLMAQYNRRNRLRTEAV